MNIDHLIKLLEDYKVHKKYPNIKDKVATGKYNRIYFKNRVNFYDDKITKKEENHLKAEFKIHDISKYKISYNHFSKIFCKHFHNGKFYHMNSFTDRKLFLVISNIDTSKFIINIEINYNSIRIDEIGKFPNYIRSTKTKEDLFQIDLECNIHPLINSENITRIQKVLKHKPIGEYIIYLKD